MEAKTIEERAVWAAVREAPLREVISTVKAAVGVWAGLMFFSAAVGFGLDFARSLVALPESTIAVPQIPLWLGLTLCAASLLWLVRAGGVDHATELVRDICALSRTTCVVFTLLLGIQFYAFANLHWLIAIGIAWALTVGVFSVEQLATAGRAARKSKPLATE